MCRYCHLESKALSDLSTDPIVLELRQADLPIDVMCCDNGWNIVKRIYESSSVPDKAWHQLCRERAFLKY